MKWSVSWSLNSKVLSLLGMARRANRISLGHDACETSVKNGNASLVAVSRDASERLKDEMSGLSATYKKDFIELDCDKNELGAALGAKTTAVLSIDDAGFAKRIIELTREE